MNLASQKLQQGLEAEKKLYIRRDYKSEACKSEKPFLVIVDVFYSSSSGDSDHRRRFRQLEWKSSFSIKRHLTVNT